MISLKTDKDLLKMRECGRLVALAIREMAAHIRPGITTGELDRVGHDFLARNGAKPSFLNYRGFPKSVCISVNDEVVHGIPGPRELREGDIVTLDIGAFKDGFHGDGAWTFPVGEISPTARRLLNVTRESLYQGIAQARAGKTTGHIGHAIQSYVESQGCSVVRDLVGHAIGRRLHEQPDVPNFGRPGRGETLRPGMTICIEPMINEGRPEVKTLADDWTVVTQDGKLSAHFEHMVAITDGAPEILTALPEEEAIHA